MATEVRHNPIKELKQVGQSLCVQSQEIAEHLVGVLAQTRRAEWCRRRCPLDMKRRANQVHRVPIRITHRQLQAAILLRTHSGMSVEIADQQGRRRSVPRQSPSVEHVTESAG